MISVRFFRVFFVSTLFLGSFSASSHFMSLDSGYINSLYSNRGLLEFVGSMDSLHSWVFESSAKNISTPGKRSLAVFLDSIVGSWWSYVNSTAYHEFGHFSRVQAVGLRPSMINDSGSTENYFSYFGALLLNPRGPATRIGVLGVPKFMPKGAPGRFFNSRIYSGTLYNFTVNSFSGAWEVVVSAGGLNNQTRIAEMLEDATYFDEQHVGSIWAFLQNKLSVPLYGKKDKVKVEKRSGHDLAGIELGYRRMGMNITDSRQIQTSLGAFFTSFSTYRYMYAMYEYIAHGKMTFNAWEFMGFRLPDVEYFATSQGLSYKVRSGYRLSENWVIPFAVEFIVKGRSRTEPSFGVRGRLPDLYGIKLGADVIAGKKLTGGAFVSFPIKSSFDVSIGARRYHVDNLYGERNIMSLKKHLYNNEFWIGARFRY